MESGEVDELHARRLHADLLRATNRCRMMEKKIDEQARSETTVKRLEALLGGAPQDSADTSTSTAKQQEKEKQKEEAPPSPPLLKPGSIPADGLISPPKLSMSFVERSAALFNATPLSRERSGFTRLVDTLERLGHTHAAGPVLCPGSFYANTRSEFNARSQRFIAHQMAL